MLERNPKISVGKHRLSAGLLMYRRVVTGFEFLLVHPGGPFFVNKDAGAWSIPKGEPNEGEALIDAARREFREETGVEATPSALLPLGEIRQKGGKVVHAWAFEGNCDPGRITCNSVRMEFPRGSGRWTDFPEVDRADFFDLGAAREKINAAQAEFLTRLLQLLHPGAA